MTDIRIYLSFKAYHKMHFEPLPTQAQKSCYKVLLEETISSPTLEQIICVQHLTWRRQWHPTPVLLPGKSHGWRSLVGCSPWGCEESDMTERLHFHFSLSCIGEGNGNPLQCSCLENPRDGGAWWLPSMGSQRVGHDRSDLAAAAFN